MRNKVHQDYNTICNPMAPHVHSNRHSSHGSNCTCNLCRTLYRIENKIDSLTAAISDLSGGQHKILKRIKKIDKQIPEAQGD